jgi:hypothetical protein
VLGGHGRHERLCERVRVRRQAPPDPGDGSAGTDQAVDIRAYPPRDNPSAGRQVPVRGSRIARSDATIRSITEGVAPTQAVDVIKSDPPDNRVLECAAEAKSDYIVSGDRDLLRLGRFGNIHIVRVDELLEASVEHAGFAR